MSRYGEEKDKILPQQGENRIWKKNKKARKDAAETAGMRI